MWKAAIVLLTAAVLKDIHAQHTPYISRPCLGLGCRTLLPMDPVLPVSPEKVKLDVYYETNCPDSMRFITRQLYPVYLEMKDAIDIQLVPFGKASETYDTVSKK
ncbi:hypothetical protein JTE90_007101 [Oedothorax gibbosus]|uniref:Uncharacterized protein n=1 Tax=Oedothorax gibbosus TaxID=931172 RepID=A0AAV6VSK3_9ARAC|nr:hypothetical protein JTE90_007101 [Oedothorax gibbosus]